MTDTTKNARMLLDRIKSGSLGKIYVPDTVLLEFVTVLKARKFSHSQIQKLLDSLKVIFQEYSIKEASTLTLDHLKLSLEFMSMGASYFDSLIAASVTILGESIISNEPTY